eukprot:4367367-Amphidinium_carterae.1
MKRRGKRSEASREKRELRGQVRRRESGRTPWAEDEFEDKRAESVRVRRQSGDGGNAAGDAAHAATTPVGHCSVARREAERRDHREDAGSDRAPRRRAVSPASSSVGRHKRYRSAAELWLGEGGDPREELSSVAKEDAELHRECVSRPARSSKMGRECDRANKRERPGGHIRGECGRDREGSQSAGQGSSALCSAGASDGERGERHRVQQRWSWTGGMEKADSEVESSDGWSH